MDVRTLFSQILTSPERDLPDSPPSLPHNEVTQTLVDHLLLAPHPPLMNQEEWKKLKARFQEAAPQGPTTQIALEIFDLCQIPLSQNSKELRKKRIDFALQNYTESKDPDALNALFLSGVSLSFDELEALLTPLPKELQQIHCLVLQEEGESEVGKGEVLALYTDLSHTSLQKTPLSLSMSLPQNSTQEWLQKLPPKGIAQCINALEISISWLTSLEEDSFQNSLTQAYPHLSHVDFIDVENSAVLNLLPWINPDNIESFSLSDPQITSEQLPSLFSNCLSFHTDGCKGLTDLPLLPNVTLLSCIDNHKLTELPDSQTLLDLECSDCWVLEEIPSYPKLRRVNCSFCPELKKVGALDACTELNSSGCEAWEQAPSSFPQCQTFIYSTSHLTPLPTLAPEGRHTFSSVEEEENLNIWTVELEEVKQNPMFYLQEFMKKAFRSSQPAQQIRYKNQEAYDAGGVTKDFLFQILSRLFSESPSETHIQIKNGFPHANEASQLETGCFLALARLWAKSIQGRDPFPTGPLFSEEFYLCLLCYPYASRKESGSSSSLHAQLLEAIQEKDPSEETIDQRKKALTSILCFLDFSPTLASFIFPQSAPICSLTQDEVEQALYLLSLNSSSLPPANKDALVEHLQHAENQKSLLTGLIQTWEDLPDQTHVMATDKLAIFTWAFLEKVELLDLFHTLSPGELKETVEGRVSPQIISNSLVWESSLSVTPEQLATTQKYMENWLQNASEQKLKQLLVGATSRPSLQANLKIKIQLSPREKENRLPTASTCGSQLFLTVPSSEERFQNNLDIFCDQAEHAGFQFI